MSCAGSEAPLCTHVRGRRRVASRLRASPPSFRPEAKHVRKGCRTSTQAHSPVNCAAGSTARRSGGQPTLYSTAATATRAEARRQDHLSCSFMTASDSCFVHVTTSADASLKSSVKGSLRLFRTIPCLHEASLLGEARQQDIHCVVLPTKPPVGGVWPAVSRWRLVLLRLEPTTSFTWVDRFACAPELA